MRAASWLVAFAALGRPWPGAHGMTDERRLELRGQVKEAFYHAYNGYMDYAFPFDELRPVSCVGRGRDRADPGNFGVNDVLGDYLLTLVDTLDTLAILGDRAGFARAVDNTLAYLPDFNIDSHVQVFEVAIRMLGGLLSAHIIATDEDDALGMRLDRNGTYTGGLLRLARDLGYRLLPAFEASPTGIPFPRTNLKRGFSADETPTTCAAGVGTLLLEFGALSRLTNETVFEDVARLALSDMWAARSKRNLFGNTYDLVQQTWTLPVAGIGAGVDSIYEYLFKSYVYFGDDRYLQAFDASYAALLRYSRDTTGGYAFYNVHMRTAEVASLWVDALSAFFPGLMVLAGDVDGAESAYLLYFHLWRRFRAMPERFNLHSREPDIAYYVLRPEFIESTYYLYRATRDPFYLSVGEMVLRDLNELMRTQCGFTAMEDVRTHALEERMDSFVLSETFKYLYLLFDDDNPLHRLHSNHVFTTEGHVLLPLSAVRPGSMQYPDGSSFPQRRLMHAARAPAGLRPGILKTDNIRRKLRRARTDGGWFVRPAFPGGGSGAAPGLSRTSPSRLRKCPAPRAIGLAVRYPEGGGGGGAVVEAVQRVRGHQGPLAQLHGQQQLVRALQSQAATSAGQNMPLLALHTNMATETLPLRNDFDNIGALVDHAGPAGNEANRTRAAAVEAAQRIALEFGAMCSAPAHLALSRRHNAWTTQMLADGSDPHSVADIPPDADTWLVPVTRQYSITEYLLSRAMGGPAAPSIVPSHPTARRGVPLLRDLRLEGPDLASWLSPEAFYMQQQDQLNRTERLMLGVVAVNPRPRYRGCSVSGDLNGQQSRQQDEPQKQQRLVFTNGSGLVMTDYVLVRTSTGTLPSKGPWHNAPSRSGGNRNTSTMGKGYAAPTDAPYNRAPADCAAGAGAGTRDPHQVSLGGSRRHREHAGRLAYMAEMSLYRGDEPQLVPQRTAVAMASRAGAASAYGCEEYALQEKNRVRGRVLAARGGGGCTIRDKAIHATRAGARALLVALAPESEGGAAINAAGAAAAADAAPLYRLTNNPQNVCAWRAAPDDKCRPEDQHARTGLSDNLLPPPSLQGSRLREQSHTGWMHVAQPLLPITMPVVIVGAAVIDELEADLAAGLRIEVELL
ncbi:hypothetical protein H4R19_000430 [Coemansia spiralis]|nr:hypothetical protein H4R19_000430 [Coemansia spiralis]